MLHWFDISVAAKVGAGSICGTSISRTKGTIISQQRHSKIAVIGAGIGGLSAAVALAAQGYPGSVFEAQPNAGGKLRALPVGHWAIDSGPTVFSMRWVFDALFERAGRCLDDYLKLAPVEQLARHFWADGSTLDLFADIDASSAAIEALSGPKDATAYRQYVDFSSKVFNTLDSTFMQAQRPNLLQLTVNSGITGLPGLLNIKPFANLFAELQRRFEDPRLVQLFARYATYCGSSPFQAPATLALISEAERRGVWCVDGGLQALANALVQLLTELGGQLECNAAVAQINKRNGRACGITLADGTSLNFDAVVFNGDTDALATGKMGTSVAKAVTKRKPNRQSLSAVTWSFAAACTKQELAHHNVFFGGNYRDEFDALFDQRSVCDQPTIYLCASQRSAGTDPAEAEPLFALVNAPPTELSEAQLNRIEAEVAARLKHVGIALSAEHGPLHRTTPAQFAKLFPGSNGALYGSATHGWRGSFMRPGGRSRLQGLYLAGASVHPGAGIPMAAQSGQLASDCIAKDLK